MPPLLKIEDQSMPMLGGEGRSVENDTSDACEGVVGGLVDEESFDTCGGEG